MSYDLVRCRPSHTRGIVVARPLKRWCPMAVQLSVVVFSTSPRFDMVVDDSMVDSRIVVKTPSVDAFYDRGE